MFKHFSSIGVFLGLLAAGPLTGAGRASADPAILATPPFDQGVASSVMSNMDRDPAVNTLYNACPADIFRKEISVGAMLLDAAEANKERCAANPAECFRQCVERRNADHCFRLALAFQDHEAVTPPRYAQMFFQLACAQGKPSGCTNRAAHLRNASDEGDPLSALPMAEQERCERRSFAVACERDDPWGCAMLGQAHQNGEGGPPDAKLARRYYDKACRLDPEFAACDFAKDRMPNRRDRGRRRR